MKSKNKKVNEFFQLISQWKNYLSKTNIKNHQFSFFLLRRPFLILLFFSQAYHTIRIKERRREKKNS